MPTIQKQPYHALLTDSQIDRWRESFPILNQCIHLANCSQSPQSKQVRAAIDRYLDSWLYQGMDWDGWVEEVSLAKAAFARLINADPDEIAVSSSVSEAASSVAGALDFGGDRRKVVITDAEFPTINYVWLAHQRYGAEIDVIPVNERHTIELSEYRRHIDQQTLIASVTQVYYLNGFKQDLGKLAAIAHENGALLMADAYQGIGTEPIDVKAMDIDILVTGNLKYLLGLPGIAFIYMKKELSSRLSPTVTGWFGQENPFLFQTRYNDWAPSTRRLETGTPPVLMAYAARTGMELIEQVGVVAIKDQIDHLSAVALEGCLERGLTCISPLDVSQKGGTTAILTAPALDSHEVELLLRKRNIIASARGDVIRLAPHFFTKPEEITAALDAIQDILQTKR